MYAGVCAKKLPKSDLVAESFDGVKTDVIEVGKIEAE